MSVKKQGNYQFEDFNIDLAERSLMRGEHSLAVSPRTFDLLTYFVQNSQRIVSEEELMSALWPNHQSEESDVWQHIFLLRKALTSRQSGEKILLTIPGQGYCFTLPVTKLIVEETPPTPPLQLPTANFTMQFKSERKPAAPPSNEARYSNHATRTETQSSLGEPKQRFKQDDFDDVEDSPDPDLPPGRKSILRNRPSQIALALFAAIALAIGTWQALRWLRRPTPTSLSLVVTDFQNSTGDPQLDGSLQTALIIDLQQSPLIQIASPAKVSQASSESSTAPQQICRKLQDQAYITSQIHPFAVKYLITIEARDCNSNKSLASSKGLAATPDAAILLIGRMTVDLRSQLGESRPSIAQFNKPLFAKKPGSLSALKAYADANRLVAQDKPQEAIPLYQLATRLEPNFTIAYADLGAAYSNLGEHDLALTNFTKAYEQRDTTTEPARLFITSTYHRMVTGDLWAAIRNAMQWNQEYPNNPAPLGDLAQLNNEIGKPAVALDPAKQALQLNPNDGVSYLILAGTQMRLGQYDEAAATARLAIARHFDDVEIHAILLQLGFLRLDQPAMEEEITWAKGKPRESVMLLQQANMDFATGRVKAALTLLNALAASLKPTNPDQAAQILESVPRVEAELGYPESALALLTKLPAIKDSTDIPVAWAEVGETLRAEPMLERSLAAHPADTLWRQVRAPQIKAAIALVQHRPDDAIDDLEPASHFELRAFDIAALRGRAYLANKQPELAEAEFHKILDHSGIDPLSYNYPLAQLGLARSLVQQDKPVEASFAYKVVLQIWKDADPDLPSLKQAKAEYARLTSPAVKTVTK